MKNVVRGWTKAKLLSEGRKLVRSATGPISLKQAKLALLSVGYEAYKAMPRDGVAGACAYQDLLRKARAYR